jgi:hypothetical protein
MDPASAAIQALLFALFGGLTAILAALIGPTYDNLLVPELSPGALFPALTSSGGSGFLGLAADLSGRLLVDLVDPAIALVALAVGLLYLVRSVAGRLRARLEGLLPRFVVAVIVANLTVPLAGAILGLAGATYPVIAGADGGAWQHWIDIGGPGLATYSWDNGALAFVVAFVLFSLILLLAIAVAVRNALLGVLLVLLPIFSLLAPLPYAGALARRGWLWFVELAFLPCAMVVPLELAVGASSILLTLGYLVVALASPALLAMAGNSVVSMGFPSAGGAVTGGVQRGLMAASVAAEGFVRPFLPVLKAARVPGSIVGAAERAAGRGAPMQLPAFTSELFGLGSSHLLAHVARHSGLIAAPTGPAKGSGRWSSPAQRPGGSR